MNKKVIKKFGRINLLFKLPKYSKIL